MSFDPLGPFSPEAPPAPNILDEACQFKSRLPGLRAGRIERIYLHWSAAAYGCTFGDYNAMVVLLGGKWNVLVTHDPNDNAVFNDRYAEHTYQRNRRAVGICLSGMDGSQVNYHDFGADPVQMHEIEHLCAGAAALARAYGIDPSGQSESPILNQTGKEPNIMTHAECAQKDGYPEERWDLGSLVPIPQDVTLTPQMRTRCGDALRERIYRYWKLLG